MIRREARKLGELLRDLDLDLDTEEVLDVEELDLEYLFLYC